MSVDVAADRVRGRAAPVDEAAGGLVTPSQLEARAPSAVAKAPTHGIEVRSAAHDPAAAAHTDPRRISRPG